VDLGAEHAVGRTAQPVRKGQVALPAAHVRTGSVGAPPPRSASPAAWPDPRPGSTPGGSRRRPVAARPRHSNSVPLARASAHEVTRRWQLHPAIVPDVRPCANLLCCGDYCPGLRKSIAARRRVRLR
jgi:hypothetical protein